MKTKTTDKERNVMEKRWVVMLTEMVVAILSERDCRQALHELTLGTFSDVLGALCPDVNCWCTHIYDTAIKKCAPILREKCTPELIQEICSSDVEKMGEERYRSWMSNVEQRFGEKITICIWISCPQNKPASEMVREFFIRTNDLDKIINYSFSEFSIRKLTLYAEIFPTRETLFRDTN